MNSVGFASVLILLSAIGSAIGQFNFPCPSGCALSVCGTFGCSQCRFGYYVYMNKGYAGCVFKCPKGTYPNAARWCSGCGMAGCADCTSKYSCTECSLGYELQNVKCIAK